jgi:uncharacterized protein YceH (UPF0502 family)
LKAQKVKVVTSEQAIICILLARLPQTTGEIRSRTERQEYSTCQSEVATGKSQFS